MTTSLYIQCVFMLILGQALQVFLIKVPDIKQRAKLANQKFIWADWWAADWNLVIATTILGALAIIGLDELVHWKPEILDFVKWFFAAVGAVGSNAVLAKWSSYARYFNGVIDEKTNKADGLPPPTNPGK
jgi:hypothetical protein